MTSLRKLCDALDRYFRVTDFDERESWQALMSDAYKGSLQRFLTAEFANGTWNGLMLDNAPDEITVNRVYLMVFPNQDLIDTVIANEVERGAPGALIFTHHVLDYSEHEAAFHVMRVEQLEELREHHISLYVSHAPLDCHPEISTGTALANALGLKEQARFGNYHGVQAGVYGKVLSTTFQDFGDKLAKVCGLPVLRYDQCLHKGKAVQTVAIIPGGGNDPYFITEAARVGADTYVTGHWWLFGKSEFAAQDRETMRRFVENQPLNLLGASHYTSELIVMRDQMPAWFKKQGVETVLMEQADLWG